MLHCDLSKEEREVLLEVIEDYTSELGLEIADTDRKSMRDRLKAQRDVLRKISVSLGHSVDDGKDDNSKV
jgi:hypothetical protein